MFTSKRTVLLAAALAVAMLSSTAIAFEHEVALYDPTDVLTYDKAPRAEPVLIDLERFTITAPIVMALDYSLAGGPVPHAAVINAISEPAKTITRQIEPQPAWLFGSIAVSTRMTYEVAWRS